MAPFQKLHNPPDICIHNCLLRTEAFFSGRNLYSRCQASSMPPLKHICLINLNVFLYFATCVYFIRVPIFFFEKLMSFDLSWCILNSLDVFWCLLISLGVFLCLLSSMPSLKHILRGFWVFWCLLMSFDVFWCLLMPFAFFWCLLVSFDIFC